MNLTDIFKPRCKHRHTELTHPNCFRDGKPIAEAESYLKEQTKAKVLVFDVETLPIIAAIWRPYDFSIGMNQVISDWCILSWSAKWVGDNRILSDVLTSAEAVARDDKRLVTTFWKLINEADVVIAHNGKRFDIKKLNTRFWKNGLPMPSSYKVIDTLSVAKSVFGLTFNKQDFIARFIGIQEKLDTNMELWLSCNSGNSQSLSYMREYNENDVDMLEKIYLEMREWIPNHPNLQVYESKENSCPVCLNSKYEEIGYYTAKSNRYKEYRCSNCKSLWHSTKAEKTVKGKE